MCAVYVTFCIKYAQELHRTTMTLLLIRKCANFISNSLNPNINIQIFISTCYGYSCRNLSSHVVLHETCLLFICALHVNFCVKYNNIHKIFNIVTISDNNEFAFDKKVCNSLISKSLNPNINVKIFIGTCYGYSSPNSSFHVILQMYLSFVSC